MSSSGTSGRRRRRPTCRGTCRPTRSRSGSATNATTTKKPASLCGRSTASRRAATARCGRCARCPPGCGSAKRRAARAATPPPRRRARRRRARTVTVPLLQPATQAFAFSERAAGLRAAEGRFAARRAAPSARRRRSRRRSRSPPRISVVRTPTPAGGSGAGSFRLAATPSRTRRAMGPRHSRGRSGERAEREREPQGFTRS